MVYCLRKPDCDICIKLPEVSKEHCRIELNENNEVIAESDNIIAAFNKSVTLILVSVEQVL